MSDDSTPRPPEALKSSFPMSHDPFFDWPPPRKPLPPKHEPDKRSTIARVFFWTACANVPLTIAAIYFVVKKIPDGEEAAYLMMIAVKLVAGLLVLFIGAVLSFLGFFASAMLGARSRRSPKQE